MATRKQNRMLLIFMAGIVWAAAAILFFVGFQQNIVYFQDPTDLATGSIDPGTRMRLGGLVEEGSYEKGRDLLKNFRVTDGQTAINVRYRGSVPDLFREGQGVIVEGVLEQPGLFVADTVLAKHDETYMPKEVADSLKKRGVWQGQE